MCGGLQDNGEWCIPSAVRDRNGIANRDSWNIGGGDGFYVKFDPSDENYAYAESQNGNSRGCNLVTLERTTARPSAGRGAAPTAAGAAWPRRARAPLRCASTGTRRSKRRTSIRASSTSARRCCTGRRQRRDLDGDQSGFDDGHRSGDAADHGRARAAQCAVAQRRLVAVCVADVDRRIAARCARHLRRCAGWIGAGHARRRPDVDESLEELSWPAGAYLLQRGAAVALCAPAACMRRSTVTTTTTTSRTST